MTESYAQGCQWIADVKDAIGGRAREVSPRRIKDWFVERAALSPDVDASQWPDDPDDVPVRVFSCYRQYTTCGQAEGHTVDSR